MKFNLNCVKFNETISRPLIRQSFTTVLSSLYSLCSGFTLGISAALLPQLHEDQSFNYDDKMDSWIASLSPLAMLLGSLSVASLLDACGRKRTHIILGVPYLLGWCCIAFAQDSSYILAGRFLTGLSAGTNRALNMVYIGEISDPNYRTILLYLPSLFIVSGVLISHIIGTYVYWKTTALIMLVPPIIVLIVMPFAKESPLWLISKGRNDEAVEAFYWFRGSGEHSEKELASMLEKQAQTTEKGSFIDTLKVIFSMSFLKPFFILIIMILNLQLCGINVFNFYAKDICQRTFGHHLDAFTMMIMTDSIRGVLALLFCFIGKKINKKMTYIGANVGTVLSLIILVVVVALKTQYVWVGVGSLVIYAICASSIVSMGWTFVPEVLPNKTRGLGSGLISAAGYLFLFGAVKMTPGLIDRFGVVALYAKYALIAGVTAVYLTFALPNTEGKTLQSIEDSFNSNKVNESKTNSESEPKNAV